MAAVLRREVVARTNLAALYPPAFLGARSRTATSRVYPPHQPRVGLLSALRPVLHLEHVSGDFLRGPIIAPPSSRLGMARVFPHPCLSWPLRSLPLYDPWRATVPPESLPERSGLCWDVLLHCHRSDGPPRGTNVQSPLTSRRFHCKCSEGWREGAGCGEGHTPRERERRRDDSRQ